MKALVLAGGVPQVELIKNLKRRGFYVILADYTPHPTAEPYADKFYCKSTMDVEAMRKIAVNEKVEFIFTVCTDQALNTVARLSEELGLPCYIDTETALNVTNKQYMKRVFYENNIPTAKYVSLKNGEYEIPADFQYPIIVKPADCNSSKGVIKVQNEQELKNALDDAYSFSRTKSAIAEEFIEGKEISADIYVYNGKAHLLCVSESEKTLDDEKFIIFRSTVPAGIEDNVYDDIKDAAQKIVDAFSLKSCPMLMQMLYRKGKIYVIEFSARTGGGLKFQLVKENAGVDIIDLAIDASLGQAKAAEPKYTHKFIINEFIYTKGGIYDRLDGFDELQKDGVIDVYYAFKESGTDFSPEIRSSGDRIAGFNIVADSYEELIERYEKTIKGVRVLNTDGEDMMRHDLTYRTSERKLPGKEI